VRRALLTATLAAAALAAAGGPAGAADPVPCAGMHLTDPAGDQTYDTLGTADPVGAGADKGPDNLDITGVFFNLVDGKLTANIKITNLTLDIPSGGASQGGNWYYVHFKHGGKTQYVRAANTNGTVGGITYAYGNVDGNGIYTTEGQTTGTFGQGAGGVISIVVPPDIGGKAGETLAGVAAFADTIQGQDDFVGFNNHADSAPDDGNASDPNGTDYAVTACPAGSGGSGETSGGTSGTVGGGGSAAPSKLPLTAPKSLGKAAKAKKKLSFTVKASQPITNLQIALKKLGGKSPALASAKISSLKAGSTKVTLKVSKKLKKGKYTLQAQGFVSGQAASVAQTVSLK
jgi:hypothetical protein